MSDINNTLLGVDVCCKEKKQPAVASYSTDGEIMYMYKAVKKT